MVRYVEYMSYCVYSEYVNLSVSMLSFSHIKLFKSVVDLECIELTYQITDQELAQGNRQPEEALKGAHCSFED